MTAFLASATTDLATAVGALAALLAGVWGIVKLVLNQAAKDRTDDRTERKELVKALGQLAQSNEKIASAQSRMADEQAATRKELAKGNREASERNGHLGEQNIKITEMIADMTQMISDKADRNLQATQQVREQHVHLQKIDKAEIADEVIETEIVKQQTNSRK